MVIPYWPHARGGLAPVVLRSPVVPPVTSVILRTSARALFGVVESGLKARVSCLLGAQTLPAGDPSSLADVVDCVDQLSQRVDGADDERHGAFHGWPAWTMAGLCHHPVPFLCFPVGVLPGRPPGWTIQARASDRPFRQRDFGTI
jgi:hypothetical protein